MRYICKYLFVFLAVLASCATNRLPQLDTMHWLGKWYRTGDPEARRHVVQTLPDREILETRILRAWHLMRIARAPQYDELEAELLRNEYLSMRVLYPVSLSFLKAMADRTLDEGERVEMKKIGRAHV